ncbi:hypothetical protein SEA_GRETCHEN_39 [Microbacterium phage Gretchen]|uniref:Uncharacterized protein n=1 Tax=Microbacterium phage Percival TaxID=2201439 RepID=A0A2Z4Q6K9_9CAUD|nr:hypothetical protein PBI_PERCIVAL_39 [Microbacterium phage Percival]UDL14813.1 hypothetical protein SEA_GRETCHEN_39 [Microbacterium phage Gretchen]
MTDPDMLALSIIVSFFVGWLIGKAIIALFDL